jgi:hypothetical protein
MERIVILIILSLLFAAGILQAKAAVDPAKFWQDGYCVQKTTTTVGDGAKSVRAKVDGKWDSYPLVPFPQAFWDWNREKRMEYLDIFREMLTQGPGAMRSPELSGPHNGMVATYGAARKDSRFKLNNAVKGMGFLPKEDKIAELIKLLQDNIEADMLTKLDILDSLYTHAEDNYSPDRVISLELYSEPGFATQTFLNQMVNPACVTVWLDIPTYKIKQIARLLHPLDPKLTPYEKNVVTYANLIHSFFHGAFDQEFIAVIYYNIEVYDSSPGNPKGMGTKISP